MSQSWNIGDVVQLKSGGPKMTIVSRTSSNEYRCGYFKDLKDYSDIVVAADALKVPDPAPVLR